MILSGRTFMHSASAQEVQTLAPLRDCPRLLTSASFRHLQAFTACQIHAAAPADTAASIVAAALAPLKTAGIRWGAAGAGADTEDAAAAAPAAVAPQPPLRIAGIKWGVPLQPETALQEVCHGFVQVHIQGPQSTIDKPPLNSRAA